MSNDDRQLRWGHALAREHERQCWTRGIRMRKPVFVISGSETTLGFWNERQRTIGISSRLIERHPWDYVVEVLKHEMAHQYVSENLADAGQRPHGPLFRQACERLGVHPALQRATSRGSVDDLVKILDPQEGREGEDVIRRVEKLLSLANSENEHEARAASNKACHLLAKYNLSGIGAATIRPAAYISICRKKKRLSVFESYLASVLIEHYHVECVVGSVYDPMADESYRRIHVFGRPASLKVAEHVYEFLARAAERCWDRYKQTTRATYRAKKTFMFGFIEGVHTAHRKRTPSMQAELESELNLPVVSMQAIIEGNKAEIREEVRRLYPRLSRRSVDSGSGSREAFESGRDAGQKVRIRKGLGTKATSSGRALNS
ncbi:MAG: DUF2786 domain-containing protein [Deltaproteobacteria bacterium]|nr:DUF2786 domain-containing protein [Deltaproteobacteria bacterium]